MSTNPKVALDKVVEADKALKAARNAEFRAREHRSAVIADARMAGVQVAAIAEVCEDLGTARVQQIALKVLAERGQKAPRGTSPNGKAKTATKKTTSKAPVKKAATKRTSTRPTKASAPVEAKARRTTRKPRSTR